MTTADLTVTIPHGIDPEQARRALMLIEGAQMRSRDAIKVIRGRANRARGYGNIDVQDKYTGLIKELEENGGAWQLAHELLSYTLDAALKR